MISHLRPHSYGNVPVQDVSQNSTCKIALSVFEIHLSRKKNLGTLVLNLIFAKSQNSFFFFFSKTHSESGVVTEELELSHAILWVWGQQRVNSKP